MTPSPRVVSLRSRIESCRRCPRLVAFREGVEPRASYASEKYWKKPVPGFGDLGGRLLILGIAPAAHGGNRTGRPFTGDRSGRFLVRALHATGFASQATSEHWGDGLSFINCYVTAAVKCAPPGDRPTAEEFANCSGYLDEEVTLMPNLVAVLALGALSFESYLDHLARRGLGTRGPRFGHGVAYDISGVRLYASYHPSPRNTNTGRLTQQMLVRVLRSIRKDLAAQRTEPIRDRPHRTHNY